MGFGGPELLERINIVKQETGKKGIIEAPVEVGHYHPGIEA